MDFHLKDKTVCITGGNAGIGLAAAKKFAEEGCNVAICGTNPDKLKKAEAELKEISGKVYTQVVDVAVYNDMFDFAENTYNRFGSLDIWINNASIIRYESLLDMAEEDWDRVFAVNVKSIFLSAKIVKPYMEKNGGVMINAASFASVMPSVVSGAYAASKGAVVNLTKSLAAQLAPFGIRVCGYIPGMIETEMAKENIAKNREAMEAQAALHRLGTPEDLAGPIVFLASDGAGYIAGTCIEVTGGKFCVQDAQSAWK
jgi:NAD(P)-dependent dehydrogenase (short-subunit alcohol dehydrogenase family)